jgi:hypothetical protein
VSEGWRPVRARSTARRAASAHLPYAAPAIGRSDSAVIHNHRTMGSEVRLALRRLAKEPALALAAVSTLALGIGACTAMFSIVEAVLLKSMDMAQPQRLVVMWPQFGDTRRWGSEGGTGR